MVFITTFDLLNKSLRPAKKLLKTICCMVNGTKLAITHDIK